MKIEFWVFYQTALVVSAIALLVLLVMLWQRRHVNGCKGLIFGISGVLVWTIGYFLETSSTAAEIQNFFNNISMIGTTVIPSAWLIFSINYTSGGETIHGWKLLPFTVFPIVTAIFLSSNDLRHVVWETETLRFFENIVIVERSFGPYIWVMAVHHYILFLAGFTVLFFRMRRSRLFIYQRIILVVALAIPMIGTVNFLVGWLPIMHKDLTPILFTVSVVLFVFGIVRFHLFRVVPFAYSRLIQQMQDAIIVLNSSGRIIEMNVQAKQLLHLRNSDIGKRMTSLDTIPVSIRHLFEHPFDQRDVVLRESGKRCYLEIESIHLQDPNANNSGEIIIIRDVTEKKTMQEQLIAQDRLASIGELTAGVAHEINNPLSILKGIVELTLDRDLPDDVKYDMKIADEEIDRASATVKNLLSFSRGQNDGQTSFDLNALIEKTISLRRYEQKQHNIAVEVDLSSEIPYYYGNQSQIRQVLINIVINAEYFLSKAHDGGLIRITTRENKDSIVITISDNGPGIPEDRIKRIFDPFFTSKDVGEGTGLGLSICYRIIDDHSGSIEVDSILGEGTTFTITLPVLRTVPEEDESISLLAASRVI